ncbi:MAG: hypothetical protein WCO33_00895 [bacterium]
MELADRDLKIADDVSGSIKKSTKKDFVDVLKQYSIPLISVSLFLGVAIISIFPTATSIFDNYKQLDKLKASEKTNQDTLDKLTTLKERDAQTISDLATIDQIVPSEKTKIVGLQQFIQDKTKQYNLDLKEMTIGEQLQKVSDGTSTTKTSKVATVDAQGNPIKNTEDSLRVAPTTAKIEGKFADIQSFFSDFYKVNDLYIITTMNLKSSTSISPNQITTSDAKWSLDITFSKYAFSEDFLTNSVAFTKIPISSVPDSTVLKYLRDRYTK